MKLSPFTLSVLKNFATINGGVVLRPGKQQKTIQQEKAILVEATLDDEIPTEFGIYDLNQFLGNLTTLNDVDVSFTDTTATFKEDNSDFKFDYHACSPKLIVTPPDKELSLSTVDVSFKLTNSTLSKLLRLANMNGLPNLSVVRKNGELFLKIHEKANDTSNHGMMKIGKSDGKDIMATFRTENLKLLPFDYNVELQVGAFARFVSEDGKLTYFISLESK